CPIVQVVFSFLGQKPLLQPLEAEEFHHGVEHGPGSRDNRDTYERIVATEPPGEPEADGPFRRVADAILRYDIFPGWLVAGLLRRTPLQFGDTIGICYHLVPGIDLFFAARVIERFDEAAGKLWRAGFTYRTLPGH